MSLDTAIDYIGTLLGNIAAITYVTTDPPEASAEYPFATVMPSNGSFVGQPGLVFKGIHEIVATVYFNRSNLPLAYSLLPPVIVSVADELRADPALNNTVDTIISTDGSPVRYNVRFIEYAGVPTLALEFFITVKIHETP